MSQEYCRDQADASVPPFVLESYFVFGFFLVVLWHTRQTECQHGDLPFNQNMFLCLSACQG